MSITARLAVAAVMVALPTACATTPVCPETVEEAEDGTFSALGDDTYVAIGRVIRYVPSPVLDSRGYDLSIDRTLHGKASVGGTFLRVVNEIANIQAGQAVIVVAAPGSNQRFIVQGPCIPLILIEEARSSTADRPSDRWMVRIWRNGRPRCLSRR